ncbi:hypothetical protein F66182_10872 [Fusarium sp. NRRL 66182]|nr:hypothetical protein F66182_10872 [Fusarium sp. NRRL 66182]
MRSNAPSSIPRPLQVFVGSLVHRRVSRTLYGQGTGRLPGSEAAILREEVWENVNALIAEARKSVPGEGPFWTLGGDGPMEVDTTLFGFIVSALICEASPVSGGIVRTYPALVDYAGRIRDRRKGLAAITLLMYPLNLLDVDEHIGVYF